MITGVFAVEGMFVSIEPGTISGKITKIDRIKEDLWGEPCRSFLLDAIEQGNYEKDWIKQYEEPGLMYNMILVMYMIGDPGAQ